MSRWCDDPELVQLGMTYGFCHVCDWPRTTVLTKDGDVWSFGLRCTKDESHDASGEQAFKNAIKAGRERGGTA